MVWKKQLRAWMPIFALLVLLLPGFPLFFMAFGLLGAYGFLPAVMLHHLYYWLPAKIFGKTLYPVEEFGVIPTTAGYAVATVFYAAIALALSFPVCSFSAREDDSN